jgi:hypothetical protein
VADLSLQGQATLTTVANTGATPPNAPKPQMASAAGSVGAGAEFTAEFARCGGTGLMRDPIDSCGAGPGGSDLLRYLEVFLSYSPGGISLQPAGKIGSEKLITYCISVQ